jgi:hypothetical protein
MCGGRAQPEWRARTQWGLLTRVKRESLGVYEAEPGRGGARLFTLR